MSPELLMSGLYTRKSDVFAFGVLVYEIYSNGGEPYPGMNNTEVQTKVLEGYRMELPSDTSGEVVELVTKHCWDANPEARFSMAEVAKTLEKITGVHPPKKSKGVSSHFVIFLINF
jgi:tyrosine-protein kinase Fer